MTQTFMAAPVRIKKSIILFGVFLIEKKGMRKPKRFESITWTKDYNAKRPLSLVKAAEVLISSDHKLKKKI